MVARWPRPKRERDGVPLLIVPRRETVPPAFWVAARTWATKGRACWTRVERMRPGRMRISLSFFIAGLPHIAPRPCFQRRTAANAHRAEGAHIAEKRHNPLKSHNRPEPHIAAFYPAIFRSW